MQTLSEDQLHQVIGGAGDSMAKDLGQFFGGVAGWIRANPGLYFLLGPGFGGLAAAGAGFNEAGR